MDEALPRGVLLPASGVLGGRRATGIVVGQQQGVHELGQLEALHVQVALSQNLQQTRLRHRALLRRVGLLEDHVERLVRELELVEEKWKQRPIQFKVYWSCSGTRATGTM